MLVSFLVLAHQRLEVAETIPSEWYYSPEILALEMERVFARSWQLVGTRSQLKKPGDQFIASVAGEPIVVVLGKDELVRAFYNVCRHRGGPLATEDGCTSMLQCKYHGWTYDLTGMLRGVPDFDRVELFDKKDFGLKPVELDIWEDFIFVSLESGAPSLNILTNGISERIGENSLMKKQFAKRVEYSVKCNWKMYVDNYLEGYHVPIVHPELVKLYDFSEYKTDTFEWYSLQHSPLSGAENIYTSDPGEALYYFIYPNLMLNILPGRLQTNLVLPVSPTESKVIFDFYYDDITSDEALKLIDADVKFSDEVQQEDIEICELVQRGVMSRSYDRGRFSVKRENAVHHFQWLLKGSLRG